MVVSRILLAALVLGAFAQVNAAAAAGDAAAPAVIMTRAQLDAYLAANPENPFQWLSAGARERFLYSLRFNEAGLVTMNPNELSDELDDRQIRELVSLFGERILPYAPKSHVQEIRAVERHVTKRAGFGPVEREYIDFYKASFDLASADDEERARSLGELFDTRLAAHYEPAALRRLDDHELRLLRVAVRGVARATRTTEHVAAFERVFAERARRDIVSTDDVDSLRDLLVSLRRFSDARALSQKYPSAALPSLPQFRDTLGKSAAGPTVWRIEESGRRLTRVAVDVAPLRIFVAASCHLSKDAARDISADALLAPVFEQHAQWLVPAPGVESVADVARWNEELPRAQVAMIYDRADWSFLPHWLMPTFFIVRDGKVIDSATGWATGEADTRDALIAALRRTGLLPPR